MGPKQHQKIAKACRELKRVGISAGEVKGAIKELLAVYENNWEFIEDGNYRALLDFILEKRQEKEKRVKPINRKLRLHDESEEDDEDPSLMLLRRQCKRQASTSVAETPLSRSEQEVEISHAKSSPRRKKRRVPDCQILEDTDTNSFSSSCKKVRPSSASPQGRGKTLPEKKDANFDSGNSLGVINQPVPLAVEYPEMAPMQCKKIGKACRELERVGIPASEVKGAIEELLAVHENNWDFIEDVNYRVLLDCILEKKQEKEKGVKHDESEEDDEDPSLMLLRRKAKRQASTSVVEIPSSGSQQEVEVSRAKSGPLAPVQNSRRNKRRLPDFPILENTDTNCFFSSCKKVKPSSASPQDGRNTLPVKKDVELPIVEHCCKTAVTENVLDRFDGGDSLGVIKQPQDEVPHTVEYPDKSDNLPNQRIEEAWETLKPFGPSRGEVKSMLKYLLELYDNNWVSIEEKNYKPLRDYFLQEKPQMKEKDVNSNKGQTRLHDEPEDHQELESSSKTLSLGYGKCHASASPENTMPATRETETSASLQDVRKTSVAHHDSPNERKLNCEIEVGPTGSMHAEESQAAACKNLIVIECSPDNGSHDEVPLTIIHPAFGSSNGSHSDTNNQEGFGLVETSLPCTDDSLSVIKQPQDEVPLAVEHPEKLPNQRIEEALETLKPSGSSRGEVKTMLNHLLELYDNNCISIEDENYKALLNYFLQEKPQMKEKDVNSVKRQTRLHDVPEDHQELESSSKTLSLRHGKCHASVSLENTMPAIQETSSSLQGVRKTSVTHHDSPSERKLNCEIEVRPTGSMHTEDSQAAACKNLIVTECSPDNGSHDEVPLAVIHPAFGSSNGSYSDTNNQEGSGLVETSLPCMDDSLPKASQFDIASSSEGDVKISLICNSPRSNFSFPCFDKVLRTVEDKCIKPDRTTTPILNMKLMEEICESVLALGTDSAYGKKPSIQENGSISFGIRPNLSRGSITIHNLIEVLPSVPKGVTLNSLSDLHYVNGAKIKDVIIRGDFDAVDCCAYVDDITRGEERVKISLVNGCSDERLVLPNFHYIRENTVYRRADVSFSLVHILDEDCCSDCFGDCLSSGRSCACAGETGGGFAYTSGDILNEQFLEECIAMNQEEIKKRDLSSPCKIHSLAKFIKECWVKCGCTKKCGNRVVQRGITAKLQVFMASREKGWGLRTLEDLPKGAFVCEYAGEVMTKSELHGRRTEKQRAYSVLLGASWGLDNVLMDEHALRLDSTDFGNVGRFINHRCFDATLIAIPVQIESPDRAYYHLGLFTTRKIKAMEELTWDYGVSLDEFKCLCGSAHCRGNKVFEV